MAADGHELLITCLMSAAAPSTEEHSRIAHLNKQIEEQP